MNTFNIELCKVTCVELKIQAETYNDAVEILNKRLHAFDESEYHELLVEFEKSDVDNEYYYIPAMTYI